MFYPFTGSVFDWFIVGVCFTASLAVVKIYDTHSENYNWQGVKYGRSFFIVSRVLGPLSQLFALYFNAYMGFYGEHNTWLNPIVVVILLAIYSITTLRKKYIKYTFGMDRTPGESHHEDIERIQRYQSAAT